MKEPKSICLRACPVLAESGPLLKTPHLIECFFANIQHHRATFQASRRPLTTTRASCIWLPPLSGCAKCQQNLAALVDTWWLWVEQRLPPETDTELQSWLLERLLPTVYWQAQVRKTKTPALKDAYRHAFEAAWQRLHQHPLTATLSAETFASGQAWASDEVGKFQRASSPVEGRNGYLSQLNHCARGTPRQRLKVLTVIHNFDLKRADGSTAAERLFGTPFPDVFDWAVERMGALPLPRKARTPSKSKLLNLQIVPA